MSLDDFFNDKLGRTRTRNTSPLGDRSALTLKRKTNKYPDIIYIALKHYKRTWFKNIKPTKEGKMLDEWTKIQKILEMEEI